MKAQLEELISKISSGCMLPEEITRIADEAAQAYIRRRFSSPTRTSISTTASPFRWVNG